MAACALNVKVFNKKPTEKTRVILFIILLPRLTCFYTLMLGFLSSLPTTSLTYSRLFREYKLEGICSQTLTFAGFMGSLLNYR